jgi:protein involved in polysaccharide export with SLBB domain
MKIELIIVALAVALSGCTGSNRGKTVPVFSEGSRLAPLHAHKVTNDSPATNSSRNNQNEGIIQVSNILLITFADLPSGSTLPAFDQQVKDDGTVTLIYNSVFQAAGRKTGDLEKEIRDFYVPVCFVNLTVRVRISSETRFVYVSGEFRNPGLYSWTNGMRLKDAIEAAGGFTEFANRRVRLIHLDGTVERYRLRGDWVLTNNPALKPGDKVQNPRQI